MSTYRLYQEARDTAWRALLRLPDKKLPVDVDALAGMVGAEIHPFPDPKEEEKLAALIAQCGECAGVSLRVKGAWHIFIRQELDADHRRFAAAHEMGHVLLGHPTEALSPGVRRFRSLENAGDLLEETQDLADYAADIFAIRLLAPACVLHETGTDTPGGIAALCGLPPKAAAFRAERMETLNQRNVFYTNAVEAKVRDQFLPFIHAVRFPAPDRAIRLDFPERKIAGKAAAPEITGKALLPDTERRAAPNARKAPAPAKKRVYLPRWARYACAGGLIALAIIVCRMIWG